MCWVINCRVKRCPASCSAPCSRASGHSISAGPSSSAESPLLPAPHSHASDPRSCRTSAGL